MSFSSDVPLQSNQLPISVDFPSPDKPEFIDTLSIAYKRIVNSVNTKEGALYLLQEQANFNQWFSNDPNNKLLTRSVYRSVYDLVSLNGGNIPALGVVAFPHGINGLSSATLIYASCTSTEPRYFTVVYPNVYLDAVNVNFTNPVAAPLTQCYVVAEYLKS